MLDRTASFFGIESVLAYREWACGQACSEGAVVSEMHYHYSDPLDQVQGLAMPPSTMVAFLAVWGAGSPGCATRVRKRLLDLNGVLTAEIQHGIAGAFFDPRRVTVNDLKTAVMMPGDNDYHRYRAEVIDHMSVAVALHLLGKAAPQKDAGDSKPEIAFGIPQPRRRKPS